MQRLDFSQYDDQSKTKVQDFLDTVARNSESTRNAYSFALGHFRKFLEDKYGYPTTIGNIIVKIKEGRLDLYELLNNFVSYLLSLKKLTNRTIINYVAAVKSYLQYHNIDIIPYKFKYRVRLPKEYHEEEQAIDEEDIRKILRACNNQRLKAYLFVLASGGMRANETTALRLKDVDFLESPTRVHIRKENKTKRPRDIFISDEATKELKIWLNHKYSKRRIGTKNITPEKSDDDLIFTKEFDDSIKPTMLYSKINQAFRKVLKAIDFDQRKEESNRGKITFVSFRRFVRTTLSDQVSSDYAEWFIGHNKSTYWTKKPEEKKEIYLTKCMKPLTFLDFSGLVTRTKNIETQVQVLTEANTKQEDEMWKLRKKDIEREDILRSLVKAVDKLKVDKDRSEKKMKQVSKKLEEIERQAKEAEEEYESVMAHLDMDRGK
jgi:integrase